MINVQSNETHQYYTKHCYFNLLKLLGKYNFKLLNFFPQTLVPAKNSISTADNSDFQASCNAKPKA